MALNEEKLGWTTEFSGIWTFGITVYRPIWFPYILRGFYLLANVETFQILHESKWLATQVHIVCIFSGLSPEVCPEATKTLKRPTVCLVSCMQMLTECSLWLFHASWVWGYDSCQVVSNSQNTDCVWLWVWQTSSKHIDDIASTECTEGSGKQPLIEYHRSLKGIPTPTASYGHQFSVSWGHHFVEWSPRFFFSVVSRASTARCWGNWKSITLKNRIPCQSTCCIWAANGFFESKGCPKGCQKKGGSPVVGFFNATRKGCLRTYHTSYHF